MSRDSFLLWLAVFGLFVAVIHPAGAATRTATFTWTPASGPVFAYIVYASIDGGPEEFYSYVGQTSVAIEVEPNASLSVSVVAFDVAGRLGPPSDVSSPLRLCPGDFDGNGIIQLSDVFSARNCLNQLAVGTCAGADMNDDGYVAVSDYDGSGFVTLSDLIFVDRAVGTRACAP